MVRVKGKGNGYDKHYPNLGNPNPPHYWQEHELFNLAVRNTTKDVSWDIMSLLTSSSLKSKKNSIKTDYDINASIIAECIKIRDDSMTRDTMKQCDANDVVF